MKNKYRIIGLLLLMMVFGCQTEEVLDPEADTNAKEVEELTDTSNFLEFTDTESYENQIALLADMTDEELFDWAELNNKEALLLRRTGEELERIGIEDMVLAALLNEDHLINIDKKVYNVDIVNDAVQSISAEKFNGISDFGKTDMVQKFSITDNVFEPELKSTDLSARRCRGGCSSTGGYKPPNWRIWNETRGKFENMDRKIVYQKAGIYFSLQAKIKKTALSYGGDVTFGLMVNRSYAGNSTTSRWKRKKRCQVGNMHVVSEGGNRRKYNYRGYSSSRPLHAYKFRVHFYAYNSFGASFAETKEITCRSI